LEWEFAAVTAAVDFPTGAERSSVIMKSFAEFSLTAN
jgi:hypothetical protein